MHKQNVSYCCTSIKYTFLYRTNMGKVGTIRDSVSRIGLGNILKFPLYSHKAA